MTREEQVRNFVAERITYKDSRVVTMLKEAAVLGMTWADAHPISPWISVEERLPPIKIRVLFLDKNGKVWLGRNTIAMQAELETDENNNLLPPPTVPPAKPVITHWMPIPKLEAL